MGSTVTVSIIAHAGLGLQVNTFGAGPALVPVQPANAIDLCAILPPGPRRLIAVTAIVLVVERSQHLSSPGRRFAQPVYLCGTFHG